MRTSKQARGAPSQGGGETLAGGRERREVSGGVQGTAGTWRWEVQGLASAPLALTSRSRAGTSPTGVFTTAAAGALVGQGDRWGREPGGPEN